MAGSSPSLPDGSNPSAAIVQSASDVQCSRLLKTTVKALDLLIDHRERAEDMFNVLVGSDAARGFLFDKMREAFLRRVIADAAKEPEVRA